MKTLIALLRGINVGGNHVLPMKDLAAILEGLGATEVSTYIQSGNAVFRVEDENANGFAGRLASAIRQRCGFETHVLVLEPETLIRALANNPFPDAARDPAGLHLGFLAGKPATPDLARLASLRAGNERFQLGDGVLYLHLPNGAARSKLAAGAEKALGVPMTARNWNSVCKIAEMTEALQP